MWRALNGLSRYIATPRVARHRLFAWRDARVCPDSAMIAIARDDDTTFGILHSRFHEVWSLRLGTSLEDRPRYTATTTFETFPFPEGLTPDIHATYYANEPHAAAIAGAARRLVELRDRWLNPPEWVEWIDEPVPDYPKRPVPRDDAAAKELKKRTLTNLYNARPQWLADAHEALDTAVAAAYGISNSCRSQLRRHLHHKPRQMLFRKPILHRRWQQVRCVSIHSSESSAHAPIIPTLAIQLRSRKSDRLLACGIGSSGRSRTPSSRGNGQRAPRYCQSPRWPLDAGSVTRAQERAVLLPRCQPA